MEITYEKAVENAEALIKLGQQRVYLYDKGDRPWKYVTNSEPGGSHRLDIRTDARFTAVHPCGITFEWSYDIEPRSANGSGRYQIDIAGCREVLAVLPAGPREQFATQLRESAKAVRQTGRELKTAWEQHEELAISLESI